MLSAPASGHGKTSLTAALARWHRRQGRRVAVFKTGPDFLDPMVTGRAAGNTTYQLDLWMGGEADVRARLFAAAGEADLILVEGVMGLYDGEPCSADLSRQLGLPLMAIIDGAAMAGTFGAVALGLASYGQNLEWHGVVANRIGSDYHVELLRRSLPENLVWRGALPRDAALALPERHLGLVAADELENLDATLDALAEAWGRHGDTALPLSVAFAPADTLPVPRTLAGRRIAVARDEAFCFAYPANLDLLRAAGAELVPFSPLAGDALPACDAVWLPGGYPELHLQALAARRDLHAALAAHVEAGKPLVAECGGMLFLLDTLADVEGAEAAMAGVLPGSARMQPRFVALGMQEVALPEGTLRGHSFHHARADIDAAPLLRATNPNGGPSREAIYRSKRLTASFMHPYFPSNPAAAVALFGP